ncbi:hypothetical protein FXO38_05980 [Capsicum annuum]|nr:hypothetical protein FXO38_05980 [Capsicum annuum]
MENVKEWLKIASPAQSWADVVEKSSDNSMNGSEKKLVTLKASMWDNFDINKVSKVEFKLGYIKPLKAGEVVLVEIEEEDKSSEIEFNSEEGNAEVLQGEIYHSDNKALIVKEWVPEMDFSKEELFLVPIWVKLLGLNFKYRSVKSLSKIDNLIGNPLMVDKNTEEKMGLSLANYWLKSGLGSLYLRKNKVKDPKIAATIEPERDTNPSTTDLKTMQLKSNRR